MENKSQEWDEGILRDAWTYVNAARIDVMEEGEEEILLRVEERLDERLLNLG